MPMQIPAQSREAFTSSALSGDGVIGTASNPESLLDKRFLYRMCWAARVRVGGASLLPLASSF